MARRYGGTYSPDPDQPAKDASGAGTDGVPRRSRPRGRVEVDPVGGRANLMFLPPVVLLATTLTGGALGLALGLAGAASLALGAWLLRDGLRAEAAYTERKVARRPAMPRKIAAALLAGAGTGLAVAAHWGGDSLIAPLLFALSSTALHIAAFGIDPLRDKGMEGIDTFQQDRVARVVGEAETDLAAMTDAMRRINDRTAANRLAQFQATARDLIRTVEEDPRDLTAARKYLSVYLQGARDATAKYADIAARGADPQARENYLALLDDLDQNFAARTEKLLDGDRSDLTIEIEVLRERLDREGVRHK